MERGAVRARWEPPGLVMAMDLNGVDSEGHGDCRAPQNLFEVLTIKSRTAVLVEKVYKIKQGGLLNGR